MGYLCGCEGGYTEGLDLEPLTNDWVDDLLLIDEVEREEYERRQDGMDFDPDELEY